MRPLRDLDGWVWLAGRHLTLSDFAHRGRSDEIRVAVLRRDGTLVSRWRWRSPKGAGVDYGPEVSPDGRRFAFRTVTRPRGAVVVYVLRDGEKRPTPVLRHAGRQAGCGVGASFTWHGRSLLYAATDGPATIVDTGNGTDREPDPDRLAAPPPRPGRRCDGPLAQRLRAALAAITRFPPVRYPTA